MLSTWINKKYLNPKKFYTQYKRAKPYPHLELQNFLIEKKAIELLKALATEGFEKKSSDLFQFLQSKSLLASKNKTIQSFVAFLYSDEFVHYMETLTGLKFSEQNVDVHSTVYEDTDYLLCHDDELSGRSIAYLFYLSTLFKQQGGSLDLLSTKKGRADTVVKSIIPKFNTLAFFKVSKISFHQVSEVKGKGLQRIAVGGWYHDR